MKIEQEKRFALLLACKDSDYVKKRYNGYFNVFLEAFGDEGETWDLFRVVEGEFPATEDLHKYKGFVVSGSPYDAYGNDLWILRLCLLIQTLNAMHKRVLGICFGHQVLCRALGGQVGKACGGWDIGIRKVIMQDESRHFKFSERLEVIPKCVSIIECHRDEVWQVPIGAEVIASSEKTGIEMFSIGDHILGIQGHPEYNKDILHSLIDRLLADESICNCFADDVKASLEEAEPDKEFLEKLCKSFLKGE
ncbi:gamma-glutamyl peptidase 3-like [Curcuma longa]|uniref:gamma-glutamyl peptidase 3-like n=1 Tax=Curcuma longa TaxID=136217 RepID=UPI003D9E87BB